MTVSCMPVMQRHLVMFYFCVNACVLAKEVVLKKKSFSLEMAEMDVDSEANGRQF